MSDDIRVSRRIAAPAASIFDVLADPARHLEIDGSDMLRGAAPGGPITSVGDVFVMRMYFVEHGDYEMRNHVVDFERDRRIAWEPRPGVGHPDEHARDDHGWHHRWAYALVPDGPAATVVTEIYDCSRVPAEGRADMDGGRIWIPGMTETLHRLAAACETTT